MKEEILTYYRSLYPKGVPIEDFLYASNRLGERDVEQCLQTAKELVRTGELVEQGNHIYVWANPSYRLTGIFKRQPNGSGFVILEGDVDDVHIGPSLSGTAMNNDRVAITLLGKNAMTINKKPEGRIIAVLERANTSVVGTYERKAKFGFVVPDDERIGTDIYIPLGKEQNARSGAKVLVNIIKFPEAKQKTEGEVERIVGYEGDKGLDISMIMARHKLPFEFPKKVMKESESIPMSITVNPKRLDLRQLPMITIDGEDAKDLDDAVSCEVMDNGHYKLGVHIADVSHYVRSGSAIDREAYDRGTSVYLVDRVIPMLPEVLSNGICSLNAGEDRYAMTCFMEIDNQGTVVDYQIKPSMIHVDRRCSYREIYLAIAEDIIPDDLQSLMPMVHRLHTVSRILRDMRKRRGAIDFDFPEYKVMLDSEGVPLRIVKRDRTLAERLIEECMLIANETVANYLRRTMDTSVYRIHETPTEEKTDVYQKVLNCLGQQVLLNHETLTPKIFQDLLGKVSGTPYERTVQIMTLRSMQQAKYSTENAGHFGLASSCYTHFTSPIRRYPDLMVHRLLKAAIHWKGGYTERDITPDYLARAAEHASIREQIAVEAERETTDLKKVQYMAPYVGEVFHGYVSSITSFGLFVELDNGIDGLVHLSSMRDDYYYFDEDHFQLVGKHTGNTYALGDEVTVTLVKADVERKEIDFVIGEWSLDEISRISARAQSGKLAGNQPSSSKKKATKKKKTKSRKVKMKKKSKRKASRR